MFSMAAIYHKAMGPHGMGFLDKTWKFFYQEKGSSLALPESHSLPHPCPNAITQRLMSALWKYFGNVTNHILKDVS